MSLLLAEAAAKVRTIIICATIVPVSRACGNFDSIKYGTLNHCLKDFALRDFFSSLDPKRTSSRHDAADTAYILVQIRTQGRIRTSAIADHLSGNSEST